MSLDKKVNFSERTIQVDVNINTKYFFLSIINISTFKKSDNLCIVSLIHY